MPKKKRAVRQQARKKYTIIGKRLWERIRKASPWKGGGPWLSNGRVTSYEQTKKKGGAQALTTGGKAGGKDYG